MTPEIKQALLDYEEVKLQMKKGEEKLDSLKEILLPFMMENPDAKIATQLGGSFVYDKKPIWKYPPEVEAEEEKLDKMKDDAIRKGTATKTVINFIKYNSPRKPKSTDDGDLV